MNRRRWKRAIAARRGGFTLMELIVVVMILAILMSAVIPMFRNSIIGMKEESARDEFLALMKYAHERAVMQGVEYRLLFSEDEGSYWIEAVEIPDPVEAEGEPEVDENGEEIAAGPEMSTIDPDVFVPIDGPFGQANYLPDGMTFEDSRTQSDRDRNLKFIAFYPSGACDEAKVAIEKKADRKRMTITTDGRLGQFDVEGPRE